MSDAEKKYLLSDRVVRDPDVNERTESLILGLQREQQLPSNSHPYKQIMLNEFNVRLPDYVLMRVDKVTMAHSIETRCPFLDQDLVEYGASLGFDHLFDGQLGKVALRRALREWLPDNIVGRAKVGFGGGTVLEKPRVVALMREVISGSDFLKDYYSKTYLDALVDAPTSQRQLNAWNVAGFALWRRQLAVA